VRSDLLVVGSPCGNDLAGLLQRFKPVLVQALITEGAVETLDVGVLGRATRLDQDVFDAVLSARLTNCSEFDLFQDADYLTFTES
jgi:hypothetical protein